MEIRKHFTKVAAFTLTAGAVTIGGLGFGGIASADNGPTQGAPVRSNTAAPARQPGGVGFRADMLSLAAKKIGVSVESLRQDMSRGRSIQQIATQHGIVYSDLKTTLVDAEGAALQDATASGKVTQAQADQRVSNIPQQVDSFLTRVLRPARSGPATQGQGNGANFGNRNFSPSAGGANHGQPMTHR